jgi:hypothetical protein
MDRGVAAQLVEQSTNDPKFKGLNPAGCECPKSSIDFNNLQLFVHSGTLLQGWTLNIPD